MRAHLIVDQCCERQVVEDVREHLPHCRIAVFPHTLVVEPVPVSACPPTQAGSDSNYHRRATPISTAKHRPLVRVVLYPAQSRSLRHVGAASETIIWQQGTSRNRRVRRLSSQINWITIRASPLKSDPTIAATVVSPLALVVRSTAATTAVAGNSAERTPGWQESFRRELNAQYMDTPHGEHHRTRESTYR